MSGYQFRAHQCIVSVRDAISFSYCSRFFISFLDSFWVFSTFAEVPENNMHRSKGISSLQPSEIDHRFGSLDPSVHSRIYKQVDPLSSNAAIILSPFACVSLKSFSIRNANSIWSERASFFSVCEDMNAANNAHNVHVNPNPRHLHASDSNDISHHHSISYSLKSIVRIFSNSGL